MLLFQVLDDKRECLVIYCEGELKEKYDSSQLTHTWSPTRHFTGIKEYANIWCGAKSLNEVCPEILRERWDHLNKKAKAYLNSFQQAKINLNDVCFYDLVPKKFLLDFYEIKNQISQSVFENYEKPQNYEFLHDLTIFLKKIESRNLNLKIESLDLTDKKVRNSIGKVRNCPSNIVYDPWVTATGRLTTKKNSFPILTLNKELRPVLHPRNDLFVELDFNAAELRVLFALLKQDQPKDDIHMWISKNIFESKYDRDATKKKVFAWLYNPKARNKKLNSYLNREKILENYYKNGYVTTPFNRKIAVEEEKAINYMVQSTTSDLFLTSAIKIDKMLKNKKSKIAFCVHDSLVIDFAKGEKALISELAKIFSQTKFGILKTSVSIGKNYGSMRKI